MNEHSRYQEMLSAMLDGQLSDSDRAELEAHLAECPECAALYEAFAAVSGAVAAEEEIPEYLHGKIMDGINAAAKKKKSAAVFKRLRPYALTAACLAVIAVGVLAVGAGRGKSADMKAAATESFAAPQTVSGYAQEAKAVAPAEYAVATNDAAPEAEEVAKEDAVPAPTPAPESPETISETQKVESVPAAGNDGAEAPAEAKEPQMLTIDAAKSVVTTVIDGKSVTEKLDSTDTRVWLKTLMENGPLKGAEYKMEITRENGDVAALTLWGEDKALFARFEGDEEDTEIHSLNELSEFIK